MKYAISYVSTAVAGLPEEEIQNLLKLSSRNNNKSEITGILLFSNGNFFQVLEGEKSVVEKLFDTIKQDERHYDIIPIFTRKVQDQKFNSYENAFLSLDSTYNREELDYYTSHVEKLDPSIQSSVKYLLNNFS